MTIDYTAAHIQTLEMQVIRLRAERDTLRAENESLRASNRGICKLADERVAEIHRLRLEVRALERKNALLRSGIDPEASYVEAFADGANLRTVGERVMDLTKDFGELVI